MLLLLLLLPPYIFCSPLMLMLHMRFDVQPLL
jgi:hypothetical protein